MLQVPIHGFQTQLWLFKHLPSCPLYPLYIKRSQELSKGERTEKHWKRLPKNPSKVARIFQAKAVLQQKHPRLEAPDRRCLHPGSAQIKSPICW